MSNNESILSLENYFEKEKFIIPNYQRGYKWGVPSDSGDCAVSILMDNLIDAFNNQLLEYFIQGVTVTESDEGIVLIDGQQRTITFFLLLKYLKYGKLPKIDYTIREESKKFLASEKIPSSLEKENFQDIFYFKKAINTISKKLNNENNDGFKKWILESVKLFYITIDPKEATKVFSMMNGQKAVMKTDELIKSALLSRVSRTNSQQNDEWEINALRSRYGREWDKWLYWWNKKEVQSFFNSGENPMGLLLEYYFELYKGEENKYSKYTFKRFNNLFLNDQKNAKILFRDIRSLQKTFEDWFNDYATFNYLGLILKGGANKKEAILYFLRNNTIEIIKEYAKWTLVGFTHKQITQINEEERIEASRNAYNRLSNEKVYNSDGHTDALKQLLRRNVELDNELERKFDFSLYGEKSLEHIYPKSKENDLKFESNKKISIHSIGNLVLIKKNDNSSFGAKDFNDKKKKYFNLEYAKWSLKLLHSVSVFSNNEWKEENIEENQKNFLSEFKAYYELTDNE